MLFPDPLSQGLCALVLVLVWGPLAAFPKVTVAQARLLLQWGWSLQSKKGHGLSLSAPQYHPLSRLTIAASSSDRPHVQTPVPRMSTATLDGEWAPG